MALLPDPPLQLLHQDTRLLQHRNNLLFTDSALLDARFSSRVLYPGEANSWLDLSSRGRSLSQLLPRLVIVCLGNKLNIKNGRSSVPQAWW